MVTCLRLIWHFDLKKFRPNEVPRVKISLACVFASMAIGWPLIILKSGPAGWFKFWFMPWMVYHFWVKFLIPTIIVEIYVESKSMVTVCMLLNSTIVFYNNIQHFLFPVTFCWNLHDVEVHGNNYHVLGLVLYIL